MKYKITLYKESPKCPKCKIGMDFYDAIEEDASFDDGKGFRYPASRVVARLYRCPKCFNLWKVEQ